jgi:hypothetical protein
VRTHGGQFQDSAHVAAYTTVKARCALAAQRALGTA